MQWQFLDLSVVSPHTNKGILKFVFREREANAEYELEIRQIFDPLYSLFQKQKIDLRIQMLLLHSSKVTNSSHDVGNGCIE